MRPNLPQQLHNRIRPRQLNLELRARGTRVELTRLLLEGVQRKQAEQLHQHVQRLLADLALFLDLLERGEVVLDDHPLPVGLGQAVEVDEQVVPGFLLLVAVLAGLEGEEGDAPGEGGDEVFVAADDVEGAADGAAGVEVGEDACGVVCGGFVVEDGAGGFKELEGG
jgi:hypothetical protein